MLTEDQLLIAIEDMRARQESLLTIVELIEQQAMGLLNLYVTTAAVTAGGAIASLGETPLLPEEAGVALLGATIMFMAGSLGAFVAMKSAVIGLVGETATFWIWARREDSGDVNKVADSYFERQERSMRINEDHTLRSGKALQIARLCGLAAPAVALIAGGGLLMF